MKPNSKKKLWLMNCVLLSAVTLISLIGGSCADANRSQPPGNTEEQSIASGSPANKPSPVPATPVTPTPSTQSNRTPAQTPPALPSPSGYSLDATALITRQASQMTLTVDDMGPGWTRGNAVAPAIQQVTSSSHVYYTQGSAYAPGVQNTVAVYRSVDAANNAFAKEKQANLASSNPYIGNECLLNDAVPINKLLIFRKNNVVVWIWLKQYKSGDIEHYAKIVEQRITPSASLPTSANTSSTMESSESSSKPAESSSYLQSAFTKSSDGLITKQAYQMMLTHEDMGSGWVRGNIASPTDKKSTSYGHVYYTQGSSFAPGVQNTVRVYRDTKTAAGVYAGEKPENVSLAYPDIGDECFLNNSVTIDRKLVFRKANVVVWIWLKQYKTGDIEGYARTVEQKITP